MPARPLSHRLSVVLLTYECAHRVEPILTRLRPLGVPIVAVDNGSSDGTADVLRRYSEVEVVALPENVGAAGRNAGVARVRTPYLLMCDDDGWYDEAGLAAACDLFDEHPRLGLLNARILVGSAQSLDPISTEMADSPLVDPHGIPGAVLMSFMAGAVMVRKCAYEQVGGYDPRFFIGGEEETLAVKLAKAGWQMRYCPDFVMHHRPSLANATRLRAHGMRNTIVNAWLHRRFRSAVRWTAFVLADTPKNRTWLSGLGMTLAAVPWIVRERAPMTAELDRQLALLDQRRYAARRPFWTTKDWSPDDVTPQLRREAALPGAGAAADPDRQGAAGIPV